ncbi:SspB family protein [Terrihabitans sp. B22-R8]|uniref:SspB family protein n=1 Tax=Terrihabitans sp. B22-R8 TaxID=3425128 RepID=UPI00403CD9CC
MSTDLIRYDLLAQEALRGVVRRVLEDVARTGLPGEHHFYISFNTEFPGVRMSPRLRERYPEEMTVVIQHQFWDLQVTEHAFEIGLSFSNVPEMLYIPFDSISGFFDPSVKFGLKFEPITPPESDEKPDADVAAGPGAQPVSLEARQLAAAGAGGEAAAHKDDDAADSKPAASPENGAEIVSLDKFRKK